MPICNRIKAQIESIYLFIYIYIFLLLSVLVTRGFCFFPCLEGLKTQVVNLDINFAS